MLNWLVECWLNGVSWLWLLSILLVGWHSYGCNVDLMMLLLTYRHEKIYIVQRDLSSTVRRPTSVDLALDHKVSIEVIAELWVVKRRNPSHNPGILLIR